MDELKELIVEQALEISRLKKDVEMYNAFWQNSENKLKELTETDEKKLSESAIELP